MPSLNFIISGVIEDIIFIHCDSREVKILIRCGILALLLLLKQFGKPLHMQLGLVAFKVISTPDQLLQIATN